MRLRTVTTPTGAWHVFDDFTDVDDEQVPEWAQEEIGSNAAALAEWNARKQAALASGGYIITRASPADWTRQQVVDAVAALDAAEAAPLDWTPLSTAWLGGSFGGLGLGLSEPYPTGPPTIAYLFDTGTADSNPGSGKVRLDNATQGDATTIRASRTDTGSDDVTTLLTGLRSGDVVRLYAGDGPGESLTATVGSVTEHTGYVDVAITVNDGPSTPLVAEQECWLILPLSP